jgi:hypothetical protein
LLPDLHISDFGVGGGLIRLARASDGKGSESKRG